MSTIQKALVQDSCVERFQEALLKMTTKLEIYSRKEGTNPKYVAEQQANLNAIIDYFNQSQAALEVLSQSAPIFLTQWHVNSLDAQIDAKDLRNQNRTLRDDLKRYQTLAELYGWDETMVLRGFNNAEWKEIERDRSIAVARQKWPELY